MPPLTSYTKPLTAEQAAKLKPLLEQIELPPCDVIRPRPDGAVLCLRLSTWIALVEYRRNPMTGFSMHPAEALGWIVGMLAQQLLK